MEEYKASPLALSLLGCAGFFVSLYPDKEGIEMALDTVLLRQEIQKVYSQVCCDPKKGYHFHTGPGYAADLLR